MNKDKYIVKARELIRNAKNIMVLSGAGLSTEAGIPDFRSKGGLYSHDFHGYNPETVLSHSFYLNNPELFWEYLRTELNYTDIKPSESYKLIAELEKEGRVKAVVTQNIDSLHPDAGSKNIIEIHGTLKKCFCDTCGKEYPYKDMMKKDTPVYCTEEGCRGIIRPAVVLYDEDVPLMKDVIIAAEECDLLLVLGTSLLVYPVAYIPQLFLESGKEVIIINRDETPYAMAKGVTEINSSIGTALKIILDTEGISDTEELD